MSLKIIRILLNIKQKVNRRNKMFEIGNILTLADDNEYSVVDKFNDNGIIYVFLVDINNNSNIIYGKLENDEIVELSDADKLEKIIKLVYEHTHKN